jgi:hypothetical protein
MREPGTASGIREDVTFEVGGLNLPVWIAIFWNLGQSLVLSISANE